MSPISLIKILQNDITGILDSSGTVVVTYEYDTWGKMLAIEDGAENDVSGNPSHIANLNPFRYRGYYYDSEVGLYYLNSRYYDPQTGRFINADAVLGANKDILSYNLFAYCGNNPVNRTDPSGCFWQEVFAEIGNAIKGLTPVYAGLGFSTFGDGPFPFIDAAVAVIAAVLTIGAIAVGTYRAIEELSIPKWMTEEKDIAPAIPKDQPKIKDPVVFPANPANFNPAGLVPTPRPGTKNGEIISWMGPPNMEIFRWDENPNYPNGPHYHIAGMPGVHFYPGDVVPEPYASIYFPGGE